MTGPAGIGTGYNEILSIPSVVRNSYRTSDAVSLSLSLLIMEAGTLTTALVVEAAALVPTFAPLTAPPTAVFATVTQPVAKEEGCEKESKGSGVEKFHRPVRNAE